MNADSDLAYLRLAVPDLQEYLFSHELFWPLPSAPASLGVPGLGQMTLGGVALALARVKCQSTAQAAEFEGKIELVRERWRSNWSKKAAREFSSRVGLWSRTLDDILGLSEGKRAGFPAQVRVRVMLDLLTGEMAPETPREIAQLASLDARLRGVGQPGPFIWEPVFSACFPENPYWYLYLTL